MDLARMLEKCRREQWKLADLDWSEPPRPMSREDEMAIVQLFTDMAGIERFAQALFVEQERRVSDPTLKEIFRTFVVDEARHAAVAERLAAHYDVHRYKTYALNAHLVRFRPHFLAAIRELSDDVANAYITCGELILDVALLRSIDDYVKDGTSARAMKLVNRDESRHIAIDYHMIEYYASDRYGAELERRPKKRRRDHARAAWTFAAMLYYAKPFFRDVFFAPMDYLDASGRRMREAFRRVQILGRRSGGDSRPFSRFMIGLQDVYNHPLGRRTVGKLAARIVGVDPRFLDRLVTDAEIAEASLKSYDDLAEEALRAKYEN